MRFSAIFSLSYLPHGFDYAVDSCSIVEAAYGFIFPGLEIHLMETVFECIADGHSKFACSGPGIVSNFKVAEADPIAVMTFRRSEKSPITLDCGENTFLNLTVKTPFLTSRKQ